MGRRNASQRWLRFSEKLSAATRSIIDAADIPVTGREARDTKVLAATPLIRTLSNFRGAIVLVRRKMVIEARILVRNCYENLLWIDGLVCKGDAFADAMLVGERRSIAGRGQYLLDSTLIDDPTIEDKLRTQLRDIRQSLSQSRAFLNPKAVAVEGRLGQAYLIYSQLSADAARPSLSALSRYIVRSEENGEVTWEIDAEPPAVEHDLDITAAWVCSAMVGRVYRHQRVIASCPRIRSYGGCLIST